MAFPTESQGADIETLQKVAEETGYNFDILWKIYGYESSYGTDPYMNVDRDNKPKKYQGPFQFSKHLADSLGIDRLDLYESATAYVEELQTRRKSMEQNIRTTSGDFSFIDALDPALLDYLLHQQGGKGMARIALAHYSGDKYTGHEEGSKGYGDMITSVLIENMFLDDAELKQFKGKTAKDKVDYFIDYTKKQLEKR